METTMRAQRANIVLLKKGSADQTDIAAAQARYANSLRQYKNFSKRMELPEQMERVYMDGLGRVLPGRKPSKSTKHLQEQLAYVYNGEKQFIPSRSVFKNTKVIAGNGSKTDLRVAGRLSEKYGGVSSDWSKYAGKIESDKYIFGVHWYEKKDGKQYEVKLKARREKT